MKLRCAQDTLHTNSFRTFKVTIHVPVQIHHDRHQPRMLSKTMQARHPSVLMGNLMIHSLVRNAEQKFYIKKNFNAPKACTVRRLKHLIELMLPLKFGIKIEHEAM
uniref:Uncharacterized protein n=1 Tax=Glossina pallidipes TaxID=7398 RepID=A0A1B0A9T6_GLOPL